MMETPQGSRFLDWPDMPRASMERFVGAFTGPLQPPPKPRTLMVFANSLVIPVVSEYDDGTEWGAGRDEWRPYDPESHPAHAEIVRDFAAGNMMELDVVGPVQDGKTTVTIILGVLFCLIELRQSCSLMLPEAKKAKDVWEDKLLPVIMKSGYDWILPSNRKAGAGGRGGITESMLMNTGARLHLIGAGGTNQSAQSSFTVRFSFVDEASKITPTMIELAHQRIEAYDLAGRFLRTSTIRGDKNKDGHKDTTWQAYRDSTAARHWFQCPLCAEERHPSGGWQFWHHTRVRFDRTSDKTAAASVRMECLHNPAHQLTDEQRKRSLRVRRKVHRGQTVSPAGEVLGPVPDSSAKGFMWTCWDSPLRSMARIAIKWRKAELFLADTGDHSQLRVLWHEQFVEPYDGEKANRRKVVTNDGLHDLSSVSTVLKHIVPHWVRYTILTQDVQLDRHYWILIGIGWQDRWCIIDYGYEMLKPDGMDRDDYVPTDEDRIRILERMDDKARKGWQVEGLPAHAPWMRPTLRGIDIGAWQEKLIQWMSGTTWIAIKGAGLRDENGKIIKAIGKDRTVPEMVRPLLRITRPDDWSVDCWWPQCDTIRHRIHTALLRDRGPGSCEIPKGLKKNDQLCLHLSAVVWTTDDNGNSYWQEKVHPRWDLLDAAIYAYALGRYYEARLTIAAAEPPPPPRPIARPVGPAHRTTHVERRSRIMGNRRNR
jgi:phage terminase large subunit GpA-like protein